MGGPQARTLLDNIPAWLGDTLRRTSQRSDLAGAIRYALSRQLALTRHAGNGRVEIDNNTVKRLIRPTALGRKERLFAGSDTGCFRAVGIA